jgi:hypothetical protein
MMESTASERLEMRWLPVIDVAGRTRMEASWVPVPTADRQVEQPASTHAA